MESARESKALAHLLGLQMAESDGEGVSRVGGLGRFVHLQQRANHDLHLAFVGVTVTGDTGFDLAGGIAVDSNAALGGSQKNDAANFRETESSTHIQRGEDGFDGEGVGSEFIEQLAEETVDVLEDGAGEFFLAFGRDFQRAVMEQAAAVAVGFYDAVTGGARGGGVDAENAEGAIFCGASGRWGWRSHRGNFTVFDGGWVEGLFSTAGREKALRKEANELKPPWRDQNGTWCAGARASWEGC